MPLSGPGPQLLSLSHDMIQPFLGVLVARKAPLFSSERGRMVIAPAVDYAGGMFDVEHFVEEDVFYEPLRNFSGIQDLANRNGVVRGVVVTQNAAGSPL